MALCCLLPCSLMAQSSVADFVSLPNYSQLQLSPSGQYLSALRLYGDDQVLVVTDLKARETQGVLRVDNLQNKLNWYHWASDDTLLFSVETIRRDNDARYAIRRLQKMTLGKDSRPRPVVRLRDTHGQIGLVHTPQFTDRVIDFLPDDPDHVLLALDLDTPNLPAIYQVNIHNGREKRLQPARDGYDRWWTDRQHRIRLGYGRNKKQEYYRLNDIDGDGHRTLWDNDPEFKRSLSILGFGLDPNELYISAPHEKRRAVFKVDLTSESLERTLVLSDPQYNLYGSLLYSPVSGEAVGLSAPDRVHGTRYWSKEYLSLQRALDKALPDDNNALIAFSADQQKYILKSRTRISPGDYYLGDRSKGSLDYIGSELPGVTDANFAGHQRTQFETLEGRVFDGYLTLPIGYDGKRPLPTLLLPFNGPASSVPGSYDKWSALLASRGFAVYQPDLSFQISDGSHTTGRLLGERGEQLQHELIDIMDYLIETGVADPKQICLIGRGNSALLNLLTAAQYPDRVHCTASFGAITDIPMLRSQSESFVNGDIVRRNLDHSKPRHRSHSPVNLADKLSQPQLLVHGTDDRIATIEHSERLHQALLRAKQPVELVTLEASDTALENQTHRVQAMSALVAFLEKNLTL
ncbi:alpha/beta hydrolase family protein [Ferrimonas pelagia]|uniref:S9 family peptidase n=1 Tax=Ferrimonas pelagia TaxID=1177826 RepID=A0ABP9EDG6_9GAMM